MVVSHNKMRESQVVSSQRIQSVNTNAERTLEGFKAHAVFQEITKKLEEDGESFVKKIGGVFSFKVKDGPDGQEATWIVDVKNGKGCVHNDTAKKADCTISMSDADLLALMTGKMNPQTGLQEITDCKKITSLVTDTDVTLPDKLNTFFVRFEDNIVPPSQSANKDCGLSFSFSFPNRSTDDLIAITLVLQQITE
ncbi:sterol carrier protein 2-like isoform X1 [Oncorhynchus keta]|uniref:sterol carrier protein 2-like isoform X1 n=1 Tax=Oncorhynchus keta TaxID=8018 RepID=UPI0015FB26CF|nr:sterol carrier protein 2-like isoform X1 [Oncorhynchus keta]